MFEVNPVHNDIVDRIMGYAENLDRGDVLSHQLIEEASGLQKDTDPWKLLVRKLKKRMLRDRHIALWPVRSEGYRLCTKDEQLNLITEWRQRSAVRQLNRSVREVSALAMEDLTPHQQHVRAIKLQDLIRQRRAIKRNVREQRTLARRPEQTPSIGRILAGS